MFGSSASKPPEDSADVNGFDTRSGRKSSLSAAQAGLNLVQYNKNVKRNLGVLAVLEIVILILFATTVEVSTILKSPVTNVAIYGWFQDVHVMIFIGFGFLMTFMKKFGFGAVAFNMLLAVIALQLTILLEGFWHEAFLDTTVAGNTKKFDKKIPLNLTKFIQGDFGAAVVLISFGAVLGKLNPGQLIFMTFVEIFFYTLNFQVITKTLGYEITDVGGSIAVHAFGAYFGLAVSKIVTDSKKAEDKQNNFGSSYSSDLFSMIGTVFLWMFWPSFNGALAGNAQELVIMNTILALTGSCIFAFITSRFLHDDFKFDMVDIQNATLAGGVAVGSSANLFTGDGCWGALLIGAVAGVLSVVGYVKVSPWLETKFGLHDTCGVHNLHGMPAVAAAISAAIVLATNPNPAWQAKQKWIGVPIFGCTLGNTGNPWANCTPLDYSKMAGFEVAALIVTLCIAIPTGLLTGLVIKKGSLKDFPADYGNDAEYFGVPSDFPKSAIGSKPKDAVELPQV